ncbi:hypothetical protein ACGO3R_07580 [Lactococcus lactis]
MVADVKHFGKLLSKNTNQLIKGKTLVSLLLFLALGFSFVLSPSLKYPLFFVFYGIVYLLSFQLVGNLDNYKVDPNDLEKASYKYLILFALFLFASFYYVQVDYLPIV